MSRVPSCLGSGHTGSTSYLAHGQAEPDHPSDLLHQGVIQSEPSTTVQRHPGTSQGRSDCRALAPEFVG